VEMDKYLGTLVNEVQGTVNDRQAASIRLDAECMALTSDRAVSVGMIVTELLTNALKYAYPPGAEGEVRVLLKLQGEGTAILVVEDDGIGWKEGDAPKGTGLGSRIVKSMAATLGSTIEYKPRDVGTRAEMVLELQM
jgi:two-component sensor histidine kinase